MPDPVTGIIGASAASAGGNILGGIMGAKSQKDAQERSIAQTMQMFQMLTGLRNEVYGRAASDLNPFINTGTEATETLRSRMPELTAPIELTQEWLEKTPGYQWIKGQGLRAVENQNALRGLSGAQLKGAAEFVTGLADQTYKTQFDIANINKTNAFNRLFQTAESGRGAAKDLAGVDVSMTAPLIGAGSAASRDISGAYSRMGDADANMWSTIGSNVGSFVGDLPFAPYTANRLFPRGTPAAASKGMYATAVDLMPEDV